MRLQLCHFILIFISGLALNLRADVWQVGPCGRGYMSCSDSPIPTPANTNTPDPSAPTSTLTATPTITPTPFSGAFELRLNVGGSSYVDSLGNTWVADAIYSAGGYGVLPPNAGQIYATSDSLHGSPESGLYKYFRQGAQAVHVKVDVPIGTYEVIFKFADFTSVTTGARVLTLKGQGATLLAGLDLYGLGGGRGQARDFCIDVGVTSTSLDVEVDSTAGLALLNAFEVRGLQTLLTATPSPTPSFTATPTVTPNTTPIDFNLTLPPGATEL
jgi:hypothetical protein